MTDNEKAVSPDRRPAQPDQGEEKEDFWRIFYHDLLMEQQEQM